MKKIFILTCINENAEIVAIKPFKSYEDAKSDMVGQYEAEKRDAEASGFEIDDYFSGVEANTAAIKYGESEYKWQIHEVDDPVAEEYEQDRLHSEYIEDVYFDFKNKCDDMDNRILDTPVNGFTMFYLDAGNETIEVWHEPTRRWRNLFAIGIDDAYQIAKQIDDGCFSYEETEDEDE